MAAKPGIDPILADEQRLKFQKQIVQNLHRQLKVYNEAFRQFLSAEKAFYETLDNLCESGFELKGDFSKTLQSLGNIAENGARNLETIPVEETIVFRDQFGPFEKEIQDYKDKQKVSDAADKKQMAYAKKKSHDADELRKLELAAYEKKTSLGILRRKLGDELPAFYRSRMDYYSTFWRSVFQIRADIARAECETLDQLTELVRHFDASRNIEGNSAASKQQGTDPELSYEFAAANSEYASSVDDARLRLHPNGQQQQQQQQQQHQQQHGIRRVPTFGGNDMAGDSSESSGRCKPAVPRRASLRSVGNKD